MGERNLLYFIKLIRDCGISTILYLSGILAKSFVFMFLWNWFLTPIINIEIDKYQAIGLMLIILFFLPQERYKLEDHKTEMWDRFYDNLTHCGAFLVLGYILSLLLK